MAPTVIRAVETEAFLHGKAFSPDLALAAGKVAMGEVTPIDDVRSTAWYRREVTRAVTHDLLMAAWDRAAEERPSVDGALVSTPMGVAKALRAEPARAKGRGGRTDAADPAGERRTTSCLGDPQ